VPEAWEELGPEACRALVAFLEDAEHLAAYRRGEGRPDDSLESMIRAARGAMDDVSDP
jgi:hypothetical protein